MKEQNICMLQTRHIFSHSKGCFVSKQGWIIRLDSENSILKSEERGRFFREDTLWDMVA